MPQWHSIGQPPDYDRHRRWRAHDRAVVVPYLTQIGAADITADGRSTIREDVFAVNAYCPITNLGHARRPRSPRVVKQAADPLALSHH